MMGHRMHRSKNARAFLVKTRKSAMVLAKRILDVVKEIEKSFRESSRWRARKEFWIFTKKEVIFFMKVILDNV